jgi:hypothetical protein
MEVRGSLIHHGREDATIKAWRGATRLHTGHHADILGEYFGPEPVLGLPQVFEIFRN